jgi:hypothetical protein
MALFRGFLVVFLACLTAYTLIVGINHGWDLLPVFFGQIADMAWPGQFNMDFTGFLCLSAIWVAWRHRFTPGGLVLAVVAFFGGMMFLSVYLLWASRRAGGDVTVLLLGDRAKTG